MCSCGHGPIDQSLVNILAVNVGTTLAVLCITGGRAGVLNLALASVRRRIERGRCFACDYERAGLDAQTPCPECGRTPAEAPAGALAPPGADDAGAQRPARVLRVLGLVVALLLAPPLLGTLVARDALARLIAWTYVADGFTFEQGLRAAALREMHNLPSPLGVSVAMLPVAATGLLRGGWWARTPWLLALAMVGALFLSRVLGR